MGQNGLTDNQKRAIGSIVRWALLLVFAPLIKHQAVDGPVLGVAVDDLTAQIIGWLGAGGVLFWSQIQKWWVSRKIQVALAMPPSSTEGQLNSVVKATSPGIVPTGPLPTPQEAASLAGAAARP